MKTLYEMTEAYRELYARILESSEDGEIPPDAADEVMRITEAIESKLENCWKILRQLNADEKILKDEASRLTTRANTITKARDGLKEYVKEQMKNLGMSVFKGGVAWLTVQKNSQPSVNILDLNLVPQRFDKIHEREVSKSDILAHINKGLDVPGVEVVHGTHLRVK